MKISGNHTWGSRAQIGGTLKELQDLRGNKDGLWDNETKAKGTPGDVFDRQPLAVRAEAAASVGISSRDEVAELQAFRAEVEAKHGQPVMDPAVEKRLKNGELFAVQKAIAMERIGRDPSDITDGFVRASGSVDGRHIEDRDLFFQRFPPTGEPSGNVVVVSPGFQETGRNFYEQIDAMCRAGHDVVVMDHQWAGQSLSASGQRAPGGIDSGYGVARDVAAMAAFASSLAKETYGDRGDVVLFGNSMGAGPGVFGALALGEAGKIQLGGEHGQMPVGLRAVLQAPFLGATPSLMNGALQTAAKLPFLNKIQAPAAGLPDLTNDKVAEQKGAQGAVLEDVRAQLGAFEAVAKDIEAILDLARREGVPSGPIEIVHGTNDTLADASKSELLASLLGDRVHLTSLDTSDHVLQQSPTKQGEALDALERVLSRLDPAS